MLPPSLHKRVHPYPISEPGKQWSFECNSRFKKVHQQNSRAIADISLSVVAQGARGLMRRRKADGKSEWMNGKCSKET